MAKCDTTIGICADGTKARSELQKTKQSTQQFSSGVGKSLKKIALMAGAAGGAYIAMRKLGNFLKSSLRDYQNQEIATAKLATALKSTGRYSVETEQSLHDLAQEMQETTGISNDLIIAASGIMTTFTNIATDTFPEALEAAANMSAMFGQDLQQSVIQLGTALNDPITGLGRLRRIGISFTEDQKESVKQFMAQNDIMSAQRVILDELNVEIGGVAKALGQTYAGQVNVLKGAMGDLKKQMGKLIADGINPMLPKITSIIKSAEAWLSAKQDLKQIYKDLEEVAKISIENISQAEVEATIKTLWADKLKLEARALEIEASGKLGIEEKKILIAYGETVKKLDEYIGMLALEVTMTDELLIKYGLKKEAIEDLKKPTEDLTDLVTVWRDQMALAGLDAGFFTFALRDQEEAIIDLGDVIPSLSERLHDLKQDNIETGESTNDYTEKVKELTLAAEDQAMRVLPLWQQSWMTLGDTTMSVAERMKEIFKNLFASVLEMLGKELLIWATKAMIPMIGLYNPAGAAAAFAASAASFVAAGVVRSLQQGGMVGEGYGGGDKRIIAAEEGEMIIRKEVVRTNRSALEAMNAGEQGMMMVNVYLGTKKIHSEITEAIRNKQISVYTGALVNR